MCQLSANGRLPHMPSHGDWHNLYKDVWGYCKSLVRCSAHSWNEENIDFLEYFGQERLSILQWRWSAESILWCYGCDVIHLKRERLIGNKICGIWLWWFQVTDVVAVSSSVDIDSDITKLQHMRLGYMSERGLLEIRFVVYPMYREAWFLWAMRFVQSIQENQVFLHFKKNFFGCSRGSALSFFFGKSFILCPNFLR